MPQSLLLRLFALVLAVTLVGAACGGDDDDAGDAVAAQGEADNGVGTSETDEPAGDDEEDVGADPEPVAEEDPTPTPAGEFDNTDLTAKPVIEVPEGDPPAELVIEDIVEGEGAVASAGDFLIMQYVGVSYSNGLQFDASWDRGQPFTFTLGEGRVIQGWDQGIEGMAAGGRRQLVIPPELGYGEAGSGSGSIGPNETLIFTVDLVGVVPSDLEKPEVTVPDEPATELGITDIIEGVGAEATAGSAVWIHYVGVAQSTGEQFDASLDRGVEPLAFALGAGNVIPGLEQGMEGMKEGGRREIVIPADLAYGEAGAGGGVIAPGETLVFVIDLVAVG